MKIQNKLLNLTPLIPLLIVVIIGIGNLNKPVRLKILIWDTPTLNIGGWMILASTTSALFASLVINSLDNNPSYSHKYRYVKTKTEIEDNFYSNIKNQVPDREFNEPEYIDEPIPPRKPNDPKPTLSVPFRVISKPSTQEYSYDSQDDLEDPEYNYQRELTYYRPTKNRQDKYESFKENYEYINKYDQNKYDQNKYEKDTDDSYGWGENVDNDW